MTGGFDRRIVPEGVLAFLAACQSRVPFHLGGGAALAGFYLHHRLSADADLFFHDRAAHRELVRALADVSAQAGVTTRIVRDGGSFVRAEVLLASGAIAIDLVHDPVPDVESPPPAADGIVVDSLADLRANKVTCILSRSEPRDLVDLMFLDRAGFPPERDVELALRKDAGVDPGVLAWLLRDFPVTPLPIMLVPIDSLALADFRDDLSERMRHLSVP
jgi:hypothetical protein